MIRWARYSIVPSLLVSAGLLVSACREDVILGGWRELGSSSGGPYLADSSVAAPPEPSAMDAAPEAPPDDAGAATEPPPGDADAATEPPPDAGPAPLLPACGALGQAGPRAAAGALIGTTETTTDWTLPSTPHELHWPLMIEQEVAPRGPEEAPTSGYYFHEQFAFTQGVAGRLGLQAEGYYQADPPDGDWEFTKMAVFWLSGPPLEAELGDIPYPDARVAPEQAAGSQWLTIHARFAWEVCHLYVLRLEPSVPNADGTVWYSAWISDTTTGTDTLLGRMRLPADAGVLSTFGSSRTSPIDFGPPASCQLTQPVSALFGAPAALTGEHATLSANRFEAPARCGNSRFTRFAGAVRHELGLQL